MILRVAVIELGLEHLYPLPRDLGPAQAADQLLALPAEHAAGNHLDPALIRPPADDVHRDLPGRWLRARLILASFSWAFAVEPLIAGTVSFTTRSTVGGSSMPTGSSP